MASKAIGFLNFKFGADLGGFEKAMKKAQRNLKKFGKNIERTGKNLTTGLTLPIVGLGVASVKAFDEQQKAIAQVEAGLKSTGNQVGITSEKLQQMAADLQTKTLFGDEQILSDVTAQLLTFTGIAKEQFGETQLAVVNLSTKLKTDLKSTAIMVGKALNDPVTQLSALSRNGVRFTEDQKAVINALWEMGDAAGAQALILKELDTQFGGSAEAAAKAGMGPITQMKNQLSDLSEQIGERLIPHLTKFVKWIKDLGVRFDGLSESQKDNIVKWALILAAIGPVLIIFGKLSIGVASLIGVFSKLSVFLMANPYLAAAAGIAAVGAAVYGLFSGTKELTTAQDDLGSITKTANRAIMDQKVEVDQLTATLKAEGLTLEDKESALKRLQEISPAYYGSLKIAKDNVEGLDQATQAYTATLLTQAKAEAAKQKIVDLNIELLDVEMEKQEAMKGVSEDSLFGKSLIAAYTQQTENIEGRIEALSSEYTQLQKNIEANDQYAKAATGGNFWKNWKKDVKEYAEEQQRAEKVSKHITSQAGKKTKTRAPKTKSAFEIDVELQEKNYKKALNLKKETQLTERKSEEDFNKILEKEELMHLIKLKTLHQLHSKDIEDIQSQILDNQLKNQEDAFSAAEDGLIDITDLLKSLNKQQLLVNAGVELFGDVLGSSLNEAIDNQENFFKVFVDNIKKTIRQLLIQLAIMTMIDVLMGGKNMSKALLMGNAMKVMGIKEFADGGIVTGPSLGLIGEGIGTNASNPEVVAPLDKLKSMIGGGTQNVTVEGRLVGNDIYLSNERTKFNRNRTV